MIVAPPRPGFTGPVSVSSFVGTVADMRALPVLDHHQGVPDGFVVGVQALRCPWQLLPFVQAPIANLIEPSRDPLRMWYRMAPGYAAAANPWLEQVDWWIDPINGDDGAQGDSAARALASPFEWSRRFDGARFSQGYHVRILGPIPELALELELASLGHLNFDLSPAATAVAGAHVAGYVAPNGVNEYGVLNLVEALDLTPHLNRRIRFTTGAGVDAVCFIAQVNPLGGGLNTARVTQPSWADVNGPLSPVVTSVHPVPGAGDELVIETLASVDSYAVNFSQRPSGVWVNSVVLSHAGIGAAPVGLGVVQCLNPASNPSYIWGSDVRAQTVTNNVQVMASSCHGDGLGVFGEGRDRLMVVAFSDCLFRDQLLGANLVVFDSLFQGFELVLFSGYAALGGDVAFFDAANDAISTLEPGSFIITTANLYGAGNLAHGVNLPDPGVIVEYTVLPTLTGALGDTRIHGVVRAWGLMPFFDVTSGSGIVDVVP